MGMHSWIDVYGKENITDSDAKVVMLIPKQKRALVSKFFGVSLGKEGIEGRYDGYGRILMTSIYEVIAFLNVCSSDEGEYDSLTFSNRLSKDTKAVADSFRKLYKEGKVQSREELISLLDDDEQLRYLGIDLACYDEDNARLPYQIKITVHDNVSYEDVPFSMGDPGQGFCKVRVSDKDLYDYHEFEWSDYEDPYEEYLRSDERSRYESIEELEEAEIERQKLLSGKP